MDADRIAEIKATLESVCLDAEDYAAYYAQDIPDLLAALEEALEREAHWRSVCLELYSEGLKNGVLQRRGQLDSALQETGG